MPNSAARPSVVLLDVGYTLLRPHPSTAEVCVAVAHRMGIGLSLERLQATRQQVDGYYYVARAGEPHIWAAEDSVRRFWHTFYVRWLRLAGLDGHAEDLATAVYQEFALPERWCAYPDVLPALQELRALGLRLGAVSDWSVQLTPILHGLDLSRYLDFVVVSANVGAAKPDVHLYDLALRRAGTQPQETWHVGDDYRNDVLGARAAGIAPVLLDRAGTAPRLDCPVVRVLGEVAALVGVAR